MKDKLTLCFLEQYIGRLLSACSVHGMYVHSVVYTYDFVSSYLHLDLQQQLVVVFVHRNLFHDKFEKGLYKSGAVFIVCTFFRAVRHDKNNDVVQY